MEHQQFFSVSILTEKERFAMRMGFGKVPSGLSNLMLDFLLNILKAVAIEKPEGAVYRNTHSCQLGTYREQAGQEYEVYYVTEETYNALLDLKYNLKENLESYRANAESIGSNFLIQQLRQDVIGEAVK